LLPGPPHHPYHWQLRYRAFGPQARPRASSIVAVAHGQRRGLCGRMAIVAWHPRRYSSVNCELPAVDPGCPRPVSEGRWTMPARG